VLTSAQLPGPRTAALVALAALSSLGTGIALSWFEHKWPFVLSSVEPPFGLLRSALLLTFPGVLLILLTSFSRTTRVLLALASIAISVPVGFAVVIVYGCSVYQACP
jgi:hypothetical protein